MASWNSLPSEIIRKILTFTDLVVGLRPVGEPQGLVLAKTDQIPSNLFLINKQTSFLARDILYRENRIVLQADVSQYARLIRKIPKDLLVRIRRLDVILYFSYDNGLDIQTWTDLAKTFHELLDLKNLELSINGCHYYELITEDCFDFEWLKPQYEMIIAAFKVRNFQTLKSFFVFWPKYASLENKAEQEIMRDGYDSSTLGKVPYKDRDYRLPHGWEWGEQDELGNANRDWVDYEPMWMHDEE